MLGLIVTYLIVDALTRGECAPCSGTENRNPKPGPGVPHWNAGQDLEWGSRRWHPGIRTTQDFEWGLHGWQPKSKQPTTELASSP